MIELYVDGASAGNPGKSGVGIFIKGEGHNLKISERIEPTNNHTAEFKALLRGMEEVAKLTNGLVSARSDSQIVVAAVEKADRAGGIVNSADREYNTPEAVEGVDVAPDLDAPIR